MGTSWALPPSALIAASLAVACASAPSSDGAPPPDETELETVDCATLVPPTFTELESGIFTHCVPCHASTRSGDDRNGAPVAFNFDTYATAQPAAGYAAAAVRARQMPYPKGQGLTNAERNRLYEWAYCGTPP